VSDAEDRTCYLLFGLCHVTGWRDERTGPRGVAARCRGGKEKLSTLLSLCNKGKVIMLILAFIE